ncbi:LiaG family protein, partial [Bacillus sonorensis]
GLMFNGGRHIFFGKNQETVRSASASPKKINHIDIDSKSITVKIKAENRDDIDAELSGGNARLESSEQGDTLRLSVEQQGFRLFFFKKNELTVHIPYEYQDNLSITSGSGNVKILGEHLSLQKVSLSSGSGSQKVDHLQADELSVRGTSGNIRLEHVETAEADIRSTSGNTELEDVTGKLTIKHTSGNLEASFSTVNAPLRISQTSGNVRLELPDNADISLQATLTSGNISHSYPFDQTEGDKRTLIGKNGDGKNKIDISSTSGNVSID